jgi:hypothetical protein
VATRRSLRSRLKLDFWRPDSNKVWVRKNVGWGWTVNFAALRTRVSR